jgi:hypothetical protein
MRSLGCLGATEAQELGRTVVAWLHCTGKVTEQAVCASSLLLVPDEDCWNRSDSGGISGKVFGKKDQNCRELDRLSIYVSDSLSLQLRSNKTGDMV